MKSMLIAANTRSRTPEHESAADDYQRTGAERHKRCEGGFDVSVSSNLGNGESLTDGLRSRPQLLPFRRGVGSPGREPRYVCRRGSELV
jgi:hypothetical protein